MRRPHSTHKQKNRGERFFRITTMNILLLLSYRPSVAAAFFVVANVANPFLWKTTRKVTATSSLFSQQRPRDEYDDFYADFDPSIEYYSEKQQQTPSEPSRGSGYSPYERRGPSSSSRRSSRQTERGPPLPSYQRDTSRDHSNVNVPAVEALIVQRDMARRQGRFDQADQIRDVLLNEHGVQVWDRDRVWRSGCSASGSGKHSPNGSRTGSMNRGGRERSPPRRKSSLDFGVHGHDYMQVPDSIITSDLSEQEIHEKIAQRLECKLSRRFREADEIQQELANAGVYLHDGRKEWRADGERFGDARSNNNDAFGSGKPGRTMGSRNIVYTPSEYSNHASVLSSEELIQVEQLVEQRTKANLTRDYETADAIRNDLLTTYNVFLDDRLQQWSVGGTFFSASTRSRSARLDGYQPRQSSPRQQRNTQRPLTVAYDDEVGRRFRSPMQDESNNDAFSDSDYIAKDNAEEEAVDEEVSIATSTSGLCPETSTIRYDVLSDMTIPELKEKLRGQGLKVSGKKGELIERLLLHEDDSK